MNFEKHFIQTERVVGEVIKRKCYWPSTTFSTKLISIIFGFLFIRCNKEIGKYERKRWCLQFSSFAFLEYNHSFLSIFARIRR